MEQASPCESTRTKSLPIVESIRHWYSIWDLKEDGNEQREARRCGESNNWAFFSPLPPSTEKIVCTLLLILTVRVLFILMTASMIACSSEQREQGPLGPHCGEVG